MARLRYSLAQAEEEAIRLAEAFVALRPDRDLWILHHRRAFPKGSSPASKHPMTWSVMFSPNPQDGSVIDGGEMFVIVNLVTKSVELELLT